MSSQRRDSAPPDRDRGAHPREPDDSGAGQPGSSSRLEWFYGRRIDPRKPRRGLILRGSRKRHRLERQGQNGSQPPAPPGPTGSVNWTPLGPSTVARGQATGRPRVSGRITAIAVGPGGSRIYVGAANGGSWYSADGGASWTPLDDYLVSPVLTTGTAEDSRSVGALAVSFGASSATDVVWVGTGEPGAGDGYFGIGVRRSAAGGAPGSWTTEATNLASRGIYKLAIDPDATGSVYAATTAGLYRRPAGSPFTTWTLVTSPTFTNANGAVSDVIVAGTGASKRFYAAFNSERVYSSPDGATWSALSGVPAFSGRISLAAGESTPTVYAFTSTGVLVRLVGTAFQTVAGTPPAGIFFRGQGGYDLVVGVDPSNDNTVYLAGAAMWDGNDWNLSFHRGTITGGSGTYAFPFNAANANNPTADPTWVGLGVHADAHSFGFALNAAGTAHDATNVWVGTDGGVFRSTSSGAAGTFQAANTGLAITEMQFMAGRPDTDAVVFAGCQDNGNVRFWGSAAWFESPEGDGGGVAIDPNNQYQAMRQYVRAGFWYDNPNGPAGNLQYFAPGLYTSTDGGASGSWPGLTFPPVTAFTSAQKTAANNENFASGFYGPIVASPSGVAPTMVVFGTNRPWLSTDWGGTWITLPTATNPYGPATPNATQDVLDGNPVTAIAIPSANRIFIATRSQVWQLDRAGATWTRTAITTTGLPAGHSITDLATDSPTAGTFYASLGLAGSNHLWYYNGTGWVAAGPPTTTLDVPCDAVTVDPANPNVVFLGSDVGCWRGSKTGVTTWSWALYSQGLPECAITDLEVHGLSRLLRASTHGRGVWEIPIDAASGLDTELYLRVDSADTGRLSGGSRYPWVEGHPDPTRSGFSVYHWMSPDIKVRRGSLPPVDPLNTPPDFVDFAVNIDDYVDTGNIETADLSGPNRVFVQVHNRGISALAGAQVRVLLLLTDAAAGLPPLPTDYATRINAGDATNWVSGSSWQFADPVVPYRTLPTTLDARIPGVVEYQVDFSALGLPAGHDHVCAAAFVTTPTDPLVGGTTSMDQLTMQDRHAAHRNLHLVALGSRPQSPSSTEAPDVATVLLNLCNASSKRQRSEVMVDRSAFDGELSIMLPGQDDLDVRGWDVVDREGLGSSIARHLGRWIERIGEFVEREGELVEELGERLAGDESDDVERKRRVDRLKGIDTRRIFVATGDRPSIAGVSIPAKSCVAAALTIRRPENSKTGDVLHFDVVQRVSGKIVGGSSYVVRV